LTFTCPGYIRFLIYIAAIWSLAYTSAHLILAQFVLHINALLQLYAIFFVLKRPGPGPGIRRSLSRFELGEPKKYLDSDVDDYSHLYCDYEQDYSDFVKESEEQEEDPHPSELLSQPESPLFAAISPTSARTDALTTLVAKVFTGSTVMYVWKTWGYVEVSNTYYVSICYFWSKQYFCPPRFCSHSPSCSCSRSPVP
jgi:hypothetical protein